MICRLTVFSLRVWKYDINETSYVNVERVTRYIKRLALTILFKSVVVLDVTFVALSCSCSFPFSVLELSYSLFYYLFYWGYNIQRCIWNFGRARSWALLCLMPVHFWVILKRSVLQSTQIFPKCYRLQKERVKGFANLQDKS